MADDIKIVADYTDLQLMRRELVGVSKDAKASASVFEREFSKVERQLVRQEKEFRRNASASQGFYNQLLRVDSSTKSASASASVFEKQLDRVETATKRVTKAQMAATKANNNLGVVTQQAGYQVGDFIVQVQGGTNPFVAFGQQATQLVGILPLMTGLFGLSTVALIGLSAGLGVIIPLASAVGALFLNMSKSTDEAKESVKDLESELTTLDGTLKQWIKTQRAAAAGVTVEELMSTDSIKEAKGQLADATEQLRKFRQARDAITAAPTIEGAFVNAVSGFFGENPAVANELEGIQAVINAYNRLATLQQKQDQERFGNFREEYSQLQDNLQLQQTIAEFGSNSAQVKDLELQQAIDKYNKQVDAQVRANELTESQGSALKRANEEVVRLEDSTNRAADAAKRFSDNLVLGKGFLEASVRSGVASGAIPPSALGDLPQTDAEKAMQRILENRRREARKEDKPKGSVATITDPLDDLNKRITLDTKLLGVSEERAAVLRAIANSEKEYSQEAINGAISRLEVYNKEAELLEEAAAKQQQIANTMKTSMEDAFVSIVDGTKSAEDAFKDMARMIISELYKVLVVQQLVGSFQTGGGGILGSLAPIFGRASGGTVMSNTPYLVGEKGPEVIVPQNRGHVMNADLTAKAMNGSGGAVNIVQNFNFSANGDDSVKKLIAQAAPQIANMTQKQIMDSRRRGGAMKSTFG